MSTNKKNWTDGEALTTVELQREATIAATMDDRAWEGLFTPGATQKRVLPLLEETLSVNPRLLAVPGTATGAIKLQPCLLVAGGVALPQHINMSAKLEAALDSALLSSNSSGSTRYDLIYATIAYATSVSGSRKVKDVNTGTVSTQSLPLEKAVSVTLTVLPNVGNVTPTATMPADAVDGSSYNFPICYVAVANGYTSGTAHAQSAITPLWSGGFVQPQRVRGARPMAICAGSANEKAVTITGERMGSDVRFAAPFKNLPGTPTVIGSAVLLDNTIDWRNRVIWGFMGCLGLASGLPLDGTTLPSQIDVIPGSAMAGGQNFALGIFGFVNSNGGSGPLITYAGAGGGGTATINLVIDSSGALRFYRTSNPTDNVNGDLLFLTLWASDRFLAAM